MAISRELDCAGGEVLLVSKPKGWTSFDVVNMIRRLFGVRRVGHAGTLDPMATGLLVVCTAKKTKEVAMYAALEKEYDAEMVLGARTSSYDADTPVIEEKGIEGVTDERVRSVLQEFVGTYAQIPPMWSAVKVRGKRLYSYARKGVEVDRLPREVVVRSITPLSIELPRVRFTIVCSKGTYVRGVVDDVGKRLGCGAYLSALTRTRIGGFRLADAVTIDDLVAYHSSQSRRTV